MHISLLIKISLKQQLQSFRRLKTYGLNLSWCLGHSVKNTIRQEAGNWPPLSYLIRRDDWNFTNENLLPKLGTSFYTLNFYTFILYNSNTLLFTVTH